MKRKPQIIVIILTLAVILFFGAMTGGRIMDLMAGVSGMADGMSVEQAGDSYVAYNVTHPVVSYPEEYYSGDSDRVSRMAYITYDEKRQIFLKIVVSDRHTGDLDGLLRAANMSEEVKAAWGDQLDSELRPVPVTGSFASIEDADAMKALLDALSGSDFEGTEELREMALAQSDWYMLEDRYIQGVPVANLWICITVMGLNVLFLLIALTALLRKGPDRDALFGNSGSADAQLLRRQLSWLEPWCKKRGAKRVQMACLAIVAISAALVVLGFWVGGDAMYVLTCHLAIGLGAAELYGVPLLLGLRLNFDPDRLLMNYAKVFEKLYPSQPERAAVAQDLLRADDSWIVRECGKDSCVCVILGEHYWMVLKGTREVMVIDRDRIGKLYTETVSGQVRSGKVRYNYTSYVIYVYYQGNEESRKADVQFAFDTEDASGHLMSLARKRLGDQAQTVMRR